MGNNECRSCHDSAGRAKTDRCGNRAVGCPPENGPRRGESAPRYPGSPCCRHAQQGRCHNVYAHAQGIGSVTDATPKQGIMMKRANRDYDAVSGYWRCPAYGRVGSSRPQTGGDEFQAGVGRDGRSASPDLRHLRGGKAHAGGIFRSRCLLPEATVHPGPVSALHVRAIETSPGDDRIWSLSSRSATG